MIGGDLINPSRATGGTYGGRFLSGLSYSDPKAKTQVFLPVDIVPEYKATHKTGFTQFPISKRTVVSDHAIREGAMLEFTLHATNTPIDDSLRNFEFRELKVPVRASQFVAGGFLALTNAVGAAISTGLEALGLKSDPVVKIVTLQGPNSNSKEYQDRINQLYEALLLIWENTYEVTFYANGRKWKGMVITSFENTREGPAELGTFRVQAQEILYATTGESTLDLPNPADGRSGEVAEEGSKPPDEKDPRLKSTAAKLADSATFKGLIAGAGF